MRIEPAPSDAIEAGTRPAATAVAGPPLEPPDVRSRSHGLRVIPPCAVSVNGQAASSGVRVMPMTIAPAARSAATKSASAASGPPCAFVPWTLHSPATGVSSLTAIGTPRRGRSAAPPRCPAAASASASARSAKTARKALSCGSSAVMRSSAVSTSSPTSASPTGTSSACRTTPAKARSRRSVVLRDAMA